MPNLADQGQPFGKRSEAQEKGAQGANQLQDMANRLFAQTDPLRQSIISQYGQLISGGTPPWLASAFAPARDAIESQFNNVNRSITETMPRGGGMQNALLQSQIGRAGSIGTLEATLRGQGFGQAAQAAFGSPLQLPFQANAAMTNQAQIAAQQQQAKKQSKGQLGQGAGMAAAAALAA